MSKELYTTKKSKTFNYGTARFENELARQSLLESGHIDSNGNWIDQNPTKAPKIKENPMFPKGITIALWVTGTATVLGLIASALLIFTPLKEVWTSLGGNPLAPVAFSILPALAWITTVNLAFETKN